MTCRRASPARVARIAPIVLSGLIGLIGLIGLSAGLAGCDGKAEEASPPTVMGADGHGRWVVTFVDPEPDLAEYRALLTTSPGQAEAFAEKARKTLASSHAEFESSLQALSGRIVERWWMSSAVTIEVDASALPSLREAPGVKSIEPDVALGGSPKP